METAPPSQSCGYTVGLLIQTPGILAKTPSRKARKESKIGMKLKSIKMVGPFHSKQWHTATLWVHPALRSLGMKSYNSPQGESALGDRPLSTPHVATHV